MICTNRFVFLHMARTAGNFFQSFLKRFFPDHQEVGYHYPRLLLPAPYRSLPIIGFIRNPWDWYVSFYAQKASNRVSWVPAIGGFEAFATGLLHLNADTRLSIEMKRAIIDWSPETIVE